MTVKFIYFKESGKFYTEAMHEFPDGTPFYDVVKKTRHMLAMGARPGLVAGHDNFSVLLEIHMPDGPLPHLLVGAA